MCVANVNILQSRLLGDIVCQSQCLWIGSIAILHPEIGMKRSEVEWYLITDRIQDPVAHLTQFAWIVVCVRNDQIGDFKPDRGFSLQIDQSIQHRLQVRIGDLLIKLFGKRFQVDVGSIHIRKELAPRFGTDVSGGHCDRLNAQFMTGARGVDRILSPNDWIVIRESNAGATQFAGRARHGHRFSDRAQTFDLARFRNIPVLAKLAAQVATRCAKRKNRRARKKMIQWFLFDRINAKASALAVCRQHHFARSVFAHKTEPAIARF